MHLPIPLLIHPLICLPVFGLFLSTIPHYLKAVVLWNASTHRRLHRYSAIKESISGHHLISPFLCFLEKLFFSITSDINAVIIIDIIIITVINNTNGNTKSNKILKVKENGKQVRWVGSVNDSLVSNHLWSHLCKYNWTTASGCTTTCMWTKIQALGSHEQQLTRM